MGQESSQIAPLGAASEIMETSSIGDYGGVEHRDQLITQERNGKESNIRSSSSPRQKRKANYDNTMENSEQQNDNIEKRLNKKLRKVLKKKSKNKRERDIEGKSLKTQKRRHRTSDADENTLQSSVDILADSVAEQPEDKQPEPTPIHEPEYLTSSEAKPFVPDSTDTTTITSHLLPNTLSPSVDVKKGKKKTKSKHQSLQTNTFEGGNYGANEARETQENNPELLEVDSASGVAPVSSWTAVNMVPNGSRALVDTINGQYTQKHVEKTVTEEMADIDLQTDNDTITVIKRVAGEPSGPDVTELQNGQTAVAEELPQIGVYIEDEPLSKVRKRKRRLPIEDDSVDMRPKKARVALKAKSPTTRSKKTKEGAKEPPIQAGSSGPPQTSGHKASTKRTTTGATGKITDFEFGIIKNQLLKHREMNDITQEEQNRLIHGKASDSYELISMICEEIPDRTRWSLIKFCRRKFHNFQARGKWMPEDDEDLRNAFRLMPKRWTQIGERLNRHPEDCRDRWRNYLICGDNMITENWSVDEEHQLRNVVAECVSHVRELKRNGIIRIDTEDGEKYSEDSPADIDLIDWQRVSEMMGHTRSRLQCRQKWKRITEREIADKQDEKRLVVRPPSYRENVSRQHVQFMSLDDKLRIIRSIRDSQVGREGKIQWRQIGDEPFRKQWATRDLKVAFTQIKAAVPSENKYQLQELITMLIEKLENANGQDPTEEFFRVGEAPRKKKRKNLSEATIGQEDSGKDDGDDEADEIEPALEVRKSTRASPSSEKKKKLSDRMARRSESLDVDGNTIPSGGLEVPESEYGDQDDPSMANSHDSGAGEISFSNSVHDRNEQTSMSGGVANEIYVSPEPESDEDYSGLDDDIPARRASVTL